MTSTLQLVLQPRKEINRPLLAIACSVVAAHLVCILWMAVFSTHSVPASKAMPPKRFVVQTIKLNPPAATVPKVVQPLPLPAAEPVPAEPQVEPEVKNVPEPKPKTALPKEEPVVKAPPEPIKKPVVPKPATQPKSEASKPAPKKAEPAKKAEVKKAEVKKETKAPAESAAKPSPKPIVKTSPQAKEGAEKARQAELELQKQREAAQKVQRENQLKLLAQAEERIAKIGAGRGKVDSGKSAAPVVASLPGAIVSLHIDALSAAPGSAPLSFKEAAYRDELAGRLKLLLRLPEYGDVKVKLTLERSGKVANVVIESSGSEANRKYIEKTLPGLSFPAFGANFGSEARYTFSITLSNE